MKHKYKPGALVYFYYADNWMPAIISRVGNTFHPDDPHKLIYTKFLSKYGLYFENKIPEKHYPYARRAADKNMLKPRYET